MISREEATEVYFQGVGEFSKEERVEQVYDAIVDSIGTCGECKYSYSDNELYCGKSRTAFIVDTDYHNEVELVVNPSFFCADFKRKQDEVPSIR